MFSRIDRYIAKLFGVFFLGGLLVFITIFVSMDAMSTMVYYEGISMAVLPKYYMYYLPEIIYRMTPISVLFGTLFTLSSLNRSNELVALFSSGLSLQRISMPIVIAALFLCGFVFVLSDQVMPGFAKQKNFVFYHDIRKNPSLYSMVKNERIWYRSQNTIFNIKTLNEKTHKAEGLTLYYLNENWDLMQMITASQVDLKGATWDLFKGSVTIFTEDSSFPLTSSFEKKTIVMDEDSKDLSSTANTADILSLSELGAFIKKNKEAGLDTLRYEVDYHSKYGFALTALVMCLLAVPFSVSNRRGGGVMFNAGICLALVFAYWIFYSSAITLGNYGYIPPIIAAWFPNIAMAGFAVQKIRKI